MCSVPFGMGKGLGVGACMRMALSWVFVGLGFYVYNKFGLLYSFFLFLTAALLRGENDKYLKEMFVENNLIKSLFAVYYISFMLVVIFDSDMFKLGLGYKFALYLGLPVAILAAINDVKRCVLRK